MTLVPGTRYDRTTTQLLKDALNRSHEDARSTVLEVGMIEVGDGIDELEWEREEDWQRLFT